MNALSVAQIEELRTLVFQNSVELLEEAELLFQHKRFARTYTLAHLSSEELAKLPILAWVGISVVNGGTIKWKDVDKSLRSHAMKLKGLLFIDLLGKRVDLRAKEIQVHQETLSKVELFNELKNASLYAGVYQGDLYKPNAAITQTCAEHALSVSRNRLELFSEIEAITHGRIVDLAKRKTYVKLLNTLGVGEAI